MKQLQMLLLSSMVIFFTACGGGGGGDTPTVTLENSQQIAIDKIKAYADDNNQPVPTVDDYADAGVVGVTIENIYDINEVVAGLTSSEVDTTEEIQNITNNLGINILPTANAGPNKSTTVNQSVFIAGSGTDIDGTIVSYKWTKDSTVIATTASFYYMPTVVGTDTLTLTVMDDDGATASDSMNVVVSEPEPVYLAPIADAGADQNAFVGSSVTLDGNGSSDPYNNTLSYSWRVVDKPLYSNPILSNTTTVNPTFVPDRVGTYIIELTVDNGYHTRSDTVTISAQSSGIDLETGVVTNIDTFLNLYYSSMRKGTFETTEEYEQRVAEFLSLTNGEVTFISDTYMNYDADNGIGRSYAIFKRARISVNDTSLAYPGLLRRKDGTNVYEELDFDNLSIYGDPNQDVVISMNDGYGSCYKDTQDDFGRGGIKTVCSFNYYALPEEAKNYDVGFKLTVKISQFDYSFSYTTEKYYDNGYNSLSRYGFRTSLVSIILYDKNSGKELGTILSIK